MKKIIAGAASALGIAAAAAVAGCSGSTTTVREVPVAASSAAQASTPAPAATKTVTASPPASTPAGAAPAPAAPAPAAGLANCGSPPDQGGISVNSHTSCPFAENVRSAWESSGGASSVTAYSPVTGMSYTLACAATGTGYVVCSSGGNYVEFAASSASPAAAAGSGEFEDLGALSQSVTSEQQAALAAAPADDYDSTDDAGVTVSLTPLGDDTYAATASDSDGDSGTGDTITVSPDGSSWSDTGMSWNGPDVYENGGAASDWTTPTVSDYS